MDSKYNINTTQNVNIQLKIAGVGDRIIALLIDYLIYFAISILIFIISSVFIGNESDSLYVVSAILMFILFLYFFIIEYSFKGQSIGKKYRKIKVVHESGIEANLFQYLIRNLIRPIDSIYGLGLIVVFITKKDQRLGDLAAGTLVIKLDSELKIEDTIHQQYDEEYQPVYSKLDVLKIDNKDIEIIKELLSKSNNDMNWELVELMSNSMRKKMGISDSGMNNLNYLKTLVIEFNYHQNN